MASLKQMQKAAAEINEVFQNEAINVKGKEDALKEQLTQALELITPDDEFTDATQAVLDELKAKPAKKADASAAKSKGKKTPEPVEEETEDEVDDEDEVDEDEEDDDLEALKEEIETADTLKELKDIAADNEIFEVLNKKIKSYKKVEDLKEAMSEIILNALEESPEETEDDEEEEDEKGVEVIPVKKGGKKETPVLAPTKEVKKPKKEEKKPEKETTSSEKKAYNFQKKEGPGIIATISKLVEESGKKGITKDEILEHLVKMFPERSSDSMKATITVQVPNRINKEKFTVEKLENGRYRKKG